MGTVQGEEGYSEGIRWVFIGYTYVLCMFYICSMYVLCMFYIYHAEMRDNI